MPRAKCPDSALLQAYVDGTLFSRDVDAVEQHVATCERCSGVVSAMRREREADTAPTWLRPRIAGPVLAVIAVAAIVVGVLRSGPNDAQRSQAGSIAQPEPRAAASPPAAASAVEEPPPAPAPDPARSRAPKAASPPLTRSAPPAAERRPQPALKESPPPANLSPVNEVASAEGGVIVRGGRRSNRRVMWRARDAVIEHSTDGGMTWTNEYTTDRSVRAGAFVSADAAWLVGDSGLVLRRTKNGWFGAMPPAEGNIKSVRASSTSKATVTLEDGRVFTTENGGVTWAAQ